MDIAIEEGRWGTENVRLNPNIKSTYVTVFDVAKDANGIELKTNGFDFFSNNYVLIDLGENAH